MCIVCVCVKKDRDIWFSWKEDGVDRGSVDWKIQSFSFLTISTTSILWFSWPQDLLFALQHMRDHGDERSLLRREMLG